MAEHLCIDPVIQDENKSKPGAVLTASHEKSLPRLMNLPDHSPPTSDKAAHLAAEFREELETERAARFRLSLWIAAAALVVPLLPFAFLGAKVAAGVCFVAMMVCGVMLLADGAVIRGIIAVQLCLVACAWLLGGGMFVLRKMSGHGILLPWPVFPEQMAKPASDERKLQILSPPSA